MQFSMKFSVLAFLAQVAVISASPLADHNQLDDSLVARATTKLSKQQLCGVPCALEGLHGSAWQRCVEDCIRSDHPSPPPTSPQRQPQPQPLPQQKKPTKPRAKGKRASIKRPTSKRPTTKRPTQLPVTSSLPASTAPSTVASTEEAEDKRKTYNDRVSHPTRPQHQQQPLPQQKRPGVKPGKARSYEEDEE
ncbi:hypothetical protein ONZ45_g6326 [Pleurotus djamor]|nr:hypothetical protein ONZ45_g6326 [Pleurotus djamor]